MSVVLKEQLGDRAEVLQDSFHYLCGAPVDTICFHHPVGGQRYAISDRDDGLLLENLDGPQSALDTLADDLALRIVGRWVRHDIIGTYPNKSGGNHV